MDLLVHDLTLSIAARVRLQSIHLEVTKGKTLAILGGAKSGKTLLIEAIAGLRVPEKGEIFLRNQSINKLPVTSRNMGVVFQRATFFHHMNMLANFRFCITREQKKERGDDVIHRTAEKFRVAHLLSAMPSDLNAWQALQMQFVRALLCSPEALLLDSPFEQIPAGYHNTLRLLLNEQAANGVSVLFTTNNTKQAQLAGDSMLLLDQGLVLQKGTPNEFLRSPNSFFVANMVYDQGFSTINGEITKRLKTAMDCLFLDEYETRIHVPLSKVIDYQSREIMLGVAANNIHLQKPHDTNSFAVQARLVTTKQVGEKYVSLWRVRGNTVLESITDMQPHRSGLVELWITTKNTILFDEQGMTLALVEDIKNRRKPT